MTNDILAELHPVTKANFKKWHSEGGLLLLEAGYGRVDAILEQLNAYGTNWRSRGRQVTRVDVDGKHNKLYMFSNGCDEFIILVDELVGKISGKQLLVIYVIND